LSYHRTSEAAPLGGAASMTVCTNDLALCHLVDDVVELQHDRIPLAAVDARMLAQVGD
jgi:hypothetical protein